MTSHIYNIFILIMENMYLYIYLFIFGFFKFNIKRKLDKFMRKHANPDGKQSMHMTEREGEKPFFILIFEFCALQYISVSSRHPSKRI